MNLLKKLVHSRIAQWEAYMENLGKNLSVDIVSKIEHR